MHVFAESALRAFIKIHPDAAGSLRAWFKLASKEQFASLIELRNTFSDVELLKSELHCFNIGGNKYRLLANVRYRRGEIYIMEIMTHAEYSKNKWQKKYAIK